MEVKEIKENVIKIIRQELEGSSCRAFFFGSRVTGTASERSDIDVGIDADDKVPEKIFRAVKARCEALPTLYTVDVFNFSTLDDDFKKVAKSRIEEIM